MKNPKIGSGDTLQLTSFDNGGWSLHHGAGDGYRGIEVGAFTDTRDMLEGLLAYICVMEERLNAKSPE